MRRRALQFAVVREDSSLELDLWRRGLIARPVMIASGGCTALNLWAVAPALPIVFIEPNAAQIQHVRAKLRAWQRGRFASLRGELLEAGNFEALFRQFREFLFEFVMPEEDWRRALSGASKAVWRQVFAHAYWPVAFELFFSDAMLRAMFGKAAIQHAPRGSYPQHFRRCLEAGLGRGDSRTNAFLWHIFVGEYPKRGGPAYLRAAAPARARLKFFEGLAQDYKKFSGHDFVGLSNIMDWCSTAEVKFLAKKLNRELPSGAHVLYRQLNHGVNFRSAFGSGWVWDDRWCKFWHRRDQSLFYSSIHLGRKL
jgi:S-adenosylmethionine-diacylglycerol 3-amino-3-carboxypropyl transferase